MAEKKMKENEYWKIMKIIIDNKMTSEQLSKILDKNNKEKKKLKKLDRKIKKIWIEERINEIKYKEFLNNYNSLSFFQKIWIKDEEIIISKKPVFKIENNQVIDKNQEKVNNVNLLMKVFWDDKEKVNQVLDFYYRKFLLKLKIEINYTRFMDFIVKQKYKIDKEIEDSLLLKIQNVKKFNDYYFSYENIKISKLINFYLKLLSLKEEMIEVKQMFFKNHTRNNIEFINNLVALHQLKYIKIKEIYSISGTIKIKIEYIFKKWNVIKLDNSILNYLTRNKEKKYLYLLTILGYLNSRKMHTTTYKTIWKKINISENEKQNHKINLFLKELSFKRYIQNFTTDWNKVYIFKYQKTNIKKK